MIVKRGHLSILLYLLVVILLIATGRQLLELQRAQHINTTMEQLQQHKLVDADTLDLGQPKIQLAYAWHLHQRGQFEEAVDAYGRAEGMLPPEQLGKLHYNLGNLYLQEAIRLAEQLGVDRATALADVAKGLYQSALKRDPQFWLAKYNLEAAQRLSRDLPLAELRDTDEAQDSSTELWSAMPGFPLGLP